MRKLAAAPAEAGLTVADVASRYRVSPDKVRAWIARGELRAINTAAALCGRPRWVVLPESLAAFEQRRSGGAPRPARRKRRQRQTGVDYYPAVPAQAESEPASHENRMNV